MHKEAKRLKGAFVMSSTLIFLKELFPQKIFLDSADLCTALNTTPSSIRTLRCRGKFNIPSFSQGGKHLFDIRSVAKYIDEKNTPKPKRGARTKAERLAKAGV